MLDITLLGSGGGLPLPNRHLSSMMMEYRGRKILIDCGEGTQVAMKRFHTGFKTLDIICITHLHGDHIFGLPGLISTLGNSERRDPVTIIGPPGILDALRGLIYTIIPPFRIDVAEIEGDRLEIEYIDNRLAILNDVSQKGDISLSTIELDHSAKCIGYSFYINRRPVFIRENAIRLEIPQRFWGILQKGEEVQHEDRLYTPEMVLGDERYGIKVSIVTDTRPTENIPQFIKDSDIFICEGTYGDNEDIDKAIANKHMTFKEAAMLAREGSTSRLLLTHYSPSVDNPKDYIENAKNIFQNTMLGYDGFKYSLKFEDRD